MLPLIVLFAAQVTSVLNEQSTFTEESDTRSIVARTSTASKSPMATTTASIAQTPTITATPLPTPSPTPPSVGCLVIGSGDCPNIDGRVEVVVETIRAAKYDFSDFPSTITTLYITSNEDLSKVTAAELASAEGSAEAMDIIDRRLVDLRLFPVNGDNVLDVTFTGTSIAVNPLSYSKIRFLTVSTKIIVPAITTVTDIGVMGIELTNELSVRNFMVDLSRIPRVKLCSAGQLEEFRAQNIDVTGSVELKWDVTDVSFSGASVLINGVELMTEEVTVEVLGTKSEVKVNGSLENSLSPYVRLVAPSGTTKTMSIRNMKQDTNVVAVGNWSTIRVEEGNTVILGLEGVSDPTFEMPGVTGNNDLELVLARPVIVSGAFTLTLPPSFNKAKITSLTLNGATVQVKEIPNPINASLAAIMPYVQVDDLQVNASCTITSLNLSRVRLAPRAQLTLKNSSFLDAANVEIEYVLGQYNYQETSAIVVPVNVTAFGTKPPRIELKQIGTSDYYTRPEIIRIVQEATYDLAERWNGANIQVPVFYTTMVMRDYPYSGVSSVIAQFNANAPQPTPAATSPPVEEVFRLSGGAIAGIAIACVVVVLIVSAVTYFCVTKKKREAMGDGEPLAHGESQGEDVMV